jgi:hypothetical protein
MSGGFDPRNLTNAASLNSLHLEGLPAPADLAGRRFGALLSRDAVLEIATASGVGMATPATLADDLLAGLADADPVARAAASRVIEEVGRRVGYLIATLRTPETSQRQGTTPERRAVLEHWRGVTSVALGGGLLSGGLGALVTRSADAVLATIGVDVPKLVTAPRPGWLPLIGAARSIRGDTPAAIVLDCGHTSVKAAIAETRDGAVVGLRVLPPVPLEERTTEAALRAADQALARATARIGAGGPASAVQVVASLASYVVEGRPVRDGRGVYEAVDESDVWPDDCVFLHDGSAAWRAVETVDAVVLLGTWLGVGLAHDCSRLALGRDLHRQGDAAVGRHRLDLAFGLVRDDLRTAASDRSELDPL